jgi:hypothetical protein
MLKERGTTYWGYMCNQEFDKAYEFEYPVYRKTVTIVDYIRRFRPNMKWKNAVIGKIEIEDGVAMMKVKVDTDINMTVPKTPKRNEINPRLELDEKWIKVEGIWYHVPGRFRKDNKEV